MANTLTDLIPDLYAAIDQVSRELVGFIPAVGRNSNGERAAVGESVRVPVTGAANVSNISPSMSVPEPTDQTVANQAIQITKSRSAEFGFVGESQRGLNNGPGYLSVQADMIAQAVRALVNEVEVDVFNEARVTASRAFGTGGTTPFASNLNDTAQMHKILADNGQLTDKQLVIDTTAGASMRTLTNLTKANEAGSDSMLRQGVLLDVHGFPIRESAGISLQSAGTGTGYLVNNGAGYSEGDTSIVVDGGAGTILAGDSITFAGDSNKYVVTTGIAAPGTVVIAAPGLRQAVADNTAITVHRANSTFTPNVAFTRNSIQLVTRMPERPQEGDLALDVMSVTDDRSGLTFEVAMYPGHRKVRYEISLAWGVKTIKPEGVALLLG